MKIAFCFSGQLRTAEYAADGILRFIGDLLPNVDFFIHTWDQALHKRRDLKSPKITKILEQLQLEKTPHLLDYKIRLPHVHPPTFEILKKINPIYKFKLSEIENTHYSYAAFRNLYGIFKPPFYGWYKVNELKKNYEQTTQVNYDYVIRTRPDMLFPKENSLADEIDHCEKTPKCFFGIGRNDLYMNDVFYIAKSQIMDIAAEFAFQNQNEMSLHEFLKTRDISTKTTRTTLYSVYRPECIPISSLEYEKCYNIDRDWYWTRHDRFRFNI